MKSKSVKSGIKFFGINIVILLSILFFANALSYGILLIYQLIAYQVAASHKESKSKLPNYQDDPDLAKVHFQEFVRLPAQYEPFVGWSRKPFEGKTITVDLNGDRIHTNQTLDGLENGATSVHFFGGSTMWGTGANDEETIPATFNLETGVPTYNLGESGFNSRQSLARLIQLVTIHDEPVNSAVFYDGVNEVLSLCRSEHQVGDHIRTYQMRKMVNENANARPLSEFSRYLDFAFIRGTKLLVFGISQTFSDNQRWDCDSQPEKAREVAESLVETWEIAHYISEKKGITFIAILQPVAFFEEPRLDHLSHIKKEDNPLAEQFKAVYPLVQELMQERQHDWIKDYTEIFSTDEYIYIDFCHVSAFGNSLVARQISQDLDIAWKSD